MNKKANTEYTSYIIYETLNHEELKYPNNPEVEEYENHESIEHVETLHIKYEDGKAINIIVEDGREPYLQRFLEDSRYMKTEDAIGKTREETEKLLQEAFDREEYACCDEDYSIVLGYDKQPLSPNEFVHLKIAAMIEKGGYEGEEKAFAREEEKIENRDLLADKADRLDRAVRSAKWKSEKQTLSQDEVAKARFEAYKEFRKEFHK